MRLHSKAFAFFLVFVVFTFGVQAQTKKDKEKELDEIKKVDTTKLAGVWERQGTLEIDGNTDVETMQFNEDGSVSYRLNGQVGLFPTPYTYVINYGQIEVKALFDYYYIDGSLIVIFADKRVKTFTRRRGGTSQQGQPRQVMPPQQQQQQQQPMQGQQRQAMPPQQQQPQQQNLNPYLR